MGFGAYDRTRNTLVRNPREFKILRWLRNHPSSSILFHHRFPTSTDNVKNACHPFSTGDFFPTNYVLVHNGHVANADKLKEEHESLYGIKYFSTQPNGEFNDSEALLWDIALYLEGWQDAPKAYGAIAFICIAMPKDKRKSARLHFCRNGNPIRMTIDDKQIFLSSEGEGEIVPVDVLHSYNYRTRAMETKPLDIATWDRNYYANNEREHFGNYHRTGEVVSVAERDRKPIGFTPVPYSSNVDGSEDYQPDVFQEEYEEQEEEKVTKMWRQDFVLLPENENYGYNSIMPEVVNEFYHTWEGEQMAIKQKVQDRVLLYLDTNEGSYYEANKMLREDINSYENQLADDEMRETVPDYDLLLERDLLIAVRICLMTSPHWRSTMSTDPIWHDKNVLTLAATATKQFLQGRLLPAGDK